MTKKVKNGEILGSDDPTPKDIRETNPDPLEGIKAFVKNPGSLDDLGPLDKLHAIAAGNAKAPPEIELPFEQDGQTVYPKNSPIPSRHLKPGN